MRHEIQEAGRDRGNVHASVATVNRSQTSVEMSIKQVVKTRTPTRLRTARCALHI